MHYQIKNAQGQWTSVSKQQYETQGSLLYFNPSQFRILMELPPTSSFDLAKAQNLPAGTTLRQYSVNGKHVSRAAYAHTRAVRVEIDSSVPGVTLMKKHTK